jgi:hypothetical protein
MNADVHGLPRITTDLWSLCDHSEKIPEFSLQTNKPNNLITKSTCKSVNLCASALYLSLPVQTERSERKGTLALALALASASTLTLAFTSSLNRLNSRKLFS